MASPKVADLQGDRHGYLPWRQRVITLSTVALTAVAHDLTPTESGAVLFLPEVSSATLRLPRISSLSLGLNYTVYFSTAETTKLQINCALDTSAQINIPGMSSDGVGAEPSTIAPLLSSLWPGIIQLTAISSVIWMGRPGGMVGDISTGAIQDEDFEGGTWTTG
jgi:hypothetical protein